MIDPTSMRKAMKKLPPRKSLEEGEPCPNCGHEFDSDEWDVRHLSHGPSIGETWLYTCPDCEKETCSIGI
jgi:transcription elongation factor Elf1